MRHAFISYVREDLAIVDYIAEILTKNGVGVWRDTNNLAAGARWKDKIIEGIRSGSYFLPIFTKRWMNRERTYANEELALAIEELRLRSRDHIWFIPVRVDDCKIPDHPIGGGERLSDIERVDIAVLGWERGLAKLLAALGVAKPLLENGEPLAAGLSPHVHIEPGGRLIIQDSEPRIPFFMGATYQVTAGWCARTKDNLILAQLSTFAPNAIWQSVNQSLGLDSFYIVSKDKGISLDPSVPTLFTNEIEIILPRGTSIYDVNSGNFFQLTIDLNVKSEYTARGAATMIGDFSGDFKIKLEYLLPTGPMPIRVSGLFELRFKRAVGPIPN